MFVISFASWELLIRLYNVFLVLKFWLHITTCWTSYIIYLDEWYNTERISFKNCCNNTYTKNNFNFRSKVNYCSCRILTNNISLGRNLKLPDDGIIKSEQKEQRIVFNLLPNFILADYWSVGLTSLAFVPRLISSIYKIIITGFECMTCWWPTLNLTHPIITR